jgi:hypothetical protein
VKHACRRFALLHLLEWRSPRYYRSIGDRATTEDSHHHIDQRAQIGGRIALRHSPDLCSLEDAANDRDRRRSRSSIRDHRNNLCDHRPEKEKRARQAKESLPNLARDEFALAGICPASVGTIHPGFILGDSAIRRPAFRPLMPGQSLRRSLDTTFRRSRPLDCEVPGSHRPGSAAL